LALLRSFNGLWLLGDEPMAFPRLDNSPNSVGAGFLWHFCANKVTPCDWLGRALLEWHFCAQLVSLPVERSTCSISAMS
jgi:hypothetical protein